MKFRLKQLVAAMLAGAISVSCVFAENLGLKKANIISKKEQIVFRQNEIFNSENNMESEQKIVGSKIVRKRSLNNFCNKK